MGLVLDILFSNYILFFLVGYIMQKLLEYLYEKIKNRRMNQIFKERARQRRNTRDYNVKKFLASNKFPDFDRQDIILKLKDLKEIREALDQRKITSEELTMTYIYQAATKGLEMEAIADINFEWAKAQAIKCDNDFYQGISKGPLHGIPISIKDTVNLAGTVSTNGMICRSDNIIVEDGVISRALKMNGAIPYVKTNIPQLLMIPESCNSIFGVTKNFHDYGRTSGGSSGGEGALISASCSPAGIGNDIGGSVRIPAAFSGIYGFKPSNCRTTYKGHEPLNHQYPFDDEVSIFGITGPLGKSVDDLIILQKFLMSDVFIDSDYCIPPLLFDDKIVDEFAKKPKLKIGYLVYDGLFYPCAASIEAVEKSVNLLKQAGHELIELDNSYFEMLIESYGRIMFHGGDNITELLRGEPPLPQYELTSLPDMIPECLKPIICYLLNKFGLKREALLLNACGNRSNKSFSQGCLNRATVCNKHMEVWKALNLDCFIMPATGLPALKHGQGGDLSLSCFYTAVLNILDYPAGVIPNVVRVTEEHLKTPYNDDKYQDDDLVVKARECLRGSDSCKTCNCNENSRGMPIGIQVVTMVGEEEKCLGVMKQIDKIIHQ